MRPALARHRQLAALVCVLPGCRGLALDVDEPCPDCRRAWGPFLHRIGTPLPWTPPEVPACGHGLSYWDRGRCTWVDPARVIAHLHPATRPSVPAPLPVCGCTRTVPNSDATASAA